MRTFAQTPKAAPATPTAASTVAGLTFGQGRQGHSVRRPQGPSADRAAQPRVQTNAGDVRGSSTAAESARLSSDLPRIPVSTRAQTSPPASDPTGMPAGLRARMERVLEADFSDVRVRTGSARALQLSARAFARGSEIHVAPGHWAPETSEGQRLLAHELGHVLQQRDGRVPATARIAGTAINNNPAVEWEADALGARAVNARGAQADALPGRDTPSGVMGHSGVIQRKPLAPPAAGSPVEQVMQALAVISPVAGVGDFPAAFRVLDGLPVDQLLAVLTDLEARSQLDLLIANSGFAAPFDQVKLVTAMRVVRQSHGAGANLRAAEATIGASGLPAATQLAMSNYLLPPRPAVPTVRGADQRAPTAPGGAAALPTAATARELGYELDPS